MAAASTAQAPCPSSPADVLLCVLPLGQCLACLRPSVAAALRRYGALGRGGRHSLTTGPSSPDGHLRGTILLEHLLRATSSTRAAHILVAPATARRAPRGAKARGIRVSFGYGLTETSSGVAISMGDNRLQ
jgi:acyl-CoA synthetase (AMP-forming)/AMP-acid ligase II